MGGPFLWKSKPFTVYSWYSRTISGMVTMHSRVVMALMALA